MAKITYPQQLPEDANSIKHVSIGQTRDGKDEFITPVTIWEVDKSTGKHVPAGESAEVNAPRVKLDTEAQTTLEAVQAELELVKSELATIKANQTSGNQKVKDEASSSGLSANRPQANAVRAGYIYYSVDTDVMEYSNGTAWVVM